MRNLQKMYAAQKIWYETVVKVRRTNWLKEHGPCRICGSNKKLEVDHLDPQHKVSHRIWTWAEQRRTEELAKCQVLCNTCHKKRHAKEAAKNRIHGTVQASRTTKYIVGCHCTECRLATARDKAKWRERTGKH